MAPWIILGLLVTQTAADPAGAELARTIDAHLAARQREERVIVAPPADDAEFLRRSSLDLIGRIPKADEVLAFLANGKSDKRTSLINRLLASPEHARHFARTWRALLLPEAETEPQLRYLLPGFEAFLEQHRRDNVGFDVIVRDLLSVPIAPPDGPPEFVLRDLKRPNPLAFIAAKNAEPEKIAASSLRLFLGLRLECAQCHNHPFDQWTRQQFWNQAAFFSGIERRGKGTFAPLVEVIDRTTVPMMDTREVIPALYLDQTLPQLDGRRPARVAFAAWMTSPDNPYFAKAIVNRVWTQLMGTPLSDPVDDFSAANAPSHPELLDDLANVFRASRYDLTALTQTICHSAAYQRTSRQTHASQSRPESFARMAIKPMSPDQFADSLVQAIDAEPANESERGDMVDDPLRRRVMDLFAADGKSADPETTVVQALALMNGSIVDRATKPTTSQRLKRVVEEFPHSAEQQIESLFLVTYSRLPDERERMQMRSYLTERDDDQQPQRLGDIFWVLLNSPEFRWNH